MIVRRTHRNVWKIEASDPEVAAIHWLLVQAREREVAKGDGTWAAGDDLIADVEEIALELGLNALDSPGRLP